MQRTVVSVELWNRFLRDTNYNWRYRAQAQEASPTPQHPAVFVSWFDATVFCEWLSDRAKKLVRLPFEAEWEYTCQRVAKGSSSGRIHDFDSWVETYGELNPSVLESHGYLTDDSCYGIWNGVCEWCLDWFHEDSYPTSDGRPRITAPSAWKVWRGGNALSEGYPRCSYRGFEDPGERSPRLGFRTVVVEPGPIEIT